MASSSEIQAVGSLPYPFNNGEGSNAPVMQLPGALQAQVNSAKQHLVTNCINNVIPTFVNILFLGSLRMVQGGSYHIAQLYPVSYALLCCLDMRHSIQTVNQQMQ